APGARCFRVVVTLGLLDPMQRGEFVAEFKVRRARSRGRSVHGLRRAFRGSSGTRGPSRPAFATARFRPMPPGEGAKRATRACERAPARLAFAGGILPEWRPRTLRTRRHPRAAQSP